MIMVHGYVYRHHIIIIIIILRGIDRSDDGRNAKRVCPSKRLIELVVVPPLLDGASGVRKQRTVDETTSKRSRVVVLGNEVWAEEKGKGGAAE